MGWQDISKFYSLLLNMRWTKGGDVTSI